MISPKVENIVATMALADALDLDAILAAVKNTEYDRKRFPGLIFRIKEPKTSMLMFTSGKANCTGAKNMDDVRRAVGFAVGQLKKGKIPVYPDPKIIVQNIVAVSDVGSVINLNAVMTCLIQGGRVEYEPEQFPGLVYRVGEPKVVVLLFKSGKLVLTGAKNIEDVKAAAIQVQEELCTSGLLA
jgi:transcription initiation factor TFIID TATA-box-binding protein